MPAILTLALNPAIDVSSEAETVATTHKVRTFNETYDPGGGGVNVARVVAALGGDAEVICLAGGVTGAFLDGLLQGAQVPHRIIRIGGNTRISFTVHEHSTGREYRFVASGPTILPQEIEACLAAIEGSEFRYLVASGSLPNGAPPDLLVRVAAIAAAKGAKFILDSSGAGLSTTLAQARAFLVKPSLNELGMLVGRPLDEDLAGEAALGLVLRGAAEMVAVTMGAAGSLLVRSSGFVRMPAIAVEARSTVGAGDSFLGAMTVALAEGRSPADAHVYATAAGAAAVLHPGTKLCRREDVARLYEQARLLGLHAYHEAETAAPKEAGRRSRNAANA